MAQGKMKVKGKVPNNKQKPKQKGKAFTRRPSKLYINYCLHDPANVYLFVSLYFADAPIQQKKQKFAESQKLKQLVSKSVNKNVEAELRSRAKEGQINLSNAQKAVAKHHKDKEQHASSSASVASG